MLIDKKTDLEMTIAALERERASLLARLEAQNISEDQELTLIDFARKVSQGLGNADADFKTRRGIIEVLGVEASPAYEDGIKTMRIKRILGEEYYVLSPTIQVNVTVN